ncbi:hypothetical protein [Guptibacillus hwajinpoensis]|uniref:hypothetical protein n=1 Tax=Guptibacillus hwajinpoensis TaxID=208199 RepID=UPI00069E9DA9|nr:hypothetical protein [Alkalihalobacillus macyae]
MKKGKGICSKFEDLPPGTLVSIMVKGSSSMMTFTFERIHKNCVFGTLDSGAPIVLDCKCICSITFPEPPPCTPMVTLFVPEEISCSGMISGCVSCGGELVANAQVILSSNSGNVSFDPNPTTTDEFGTFMALVMVDPDTNSQNATITATTTVQGQVASDTKTTVIDCPPEPCRNPNITLTIPTAIECQAELTGTVTCDGDPVENAMVNFSSNPDIVTFLPNPATTDASGNFTTTAMVPAGTDPTAVTITAVTIVNAVEATTSEDSTVSCPGEECPCKVRIGTQDSDTTAMITTSDGPSTIEGQINISAVECFTAATMCNPAVDNFQVAFSRQGTTINFVMGRRTSLSCTNGTQTTIEGTAKAAGNVYPPNTTFMVKIDLMISGPTATWTVMATDGGSNTFSTTFMDDVTPETFIGDCSSTP